MRTRIALVAIVPVALISTCISIGAASQTAAASTTIAGSATTGSKSTALGPFDVLPDQRPALTVDAAPAPAPASAPAPVAAAPAGPVDTVTPYQRAAWERVAMCEEGGDWAADGGKFSGGLGITRSNWAAYGGLEYAPEGAMATEDEQIMVAERIQSSPPDQGGCSSW